MIGFIEIAGREKSINTFAKLVTISATTTTTTVMMAATMTTATMAATMTTMVTVTTLKCRCITKGAKRQSLARADEFPDL